jgi:hypothetical protein
MAACLLLTAASAAAPAVPAESLAACVGFAGGAIVLTASVQPAALQLHVGADCTVTGAGRTAP